MQTKILIADDKQENLYLLESLLKGNGYKVTSASNGKEALESALKNPPDLIIADILMPVMDGFTLCKKWKTHDTLKQIPFVFYTATYTDAKDEEFALHLGADRFIRKPQDPDAFMEIIRDLLSKIKEGEFTPPAKPAEVDETVQLREYNQVLIRKLEDKLADYERAYKELEKSEALYHDLVETSQDLIWQCDAEGRYIYLNPAWEQVFGYKIEEMRGRKFSDFQTPEYAEHDVKEFRRLLEGNSVRGLETVHLGKAGNEIHLVFNAKFLQDENGKAAGTRGTAYDITKRKQAEDELKNQMKELDKFNKLMVGRENKMVDLKQEINLLLKRLGEPRKYNTGE